MPESFNYQAVPRNASGGTYPDQAMKVRILIVAGSPSGAVAYAEIFSTATTSLGLLNLQIGKGTPVFGYPAFSSLNWGSGSYYLRVDLDPTGGSNYITMGTTQLLSVPFALYAKSTGTSADAVKINGDQTINGHKTFTGTVSVETPVNNFDAANKAYVDQLITEIEELQLQSGIRMKDIDGNFYKTVKIGNQTWMAENLKTTKYANGSPITLVNTVSAWDAISITDKAYCWYADNVSNKDIYGGLYTWAAAMNGSAASNFNPSGVQGVCPTGWHLPSDPEWTELETYLEGNSVAGGKMKEEGTAHWWSPNTGATNESGFSGLPGGTRNENGTFEYLHSYGVWLSTSNNGTNFYFIGLHYLKESPYRGVVPKSGGYSVRCVRNQ